MDFGTRAIKILVIEDDPDNRSLLRKKLQHMCCDVIIAENDLEGLQLGLIIQPDLILLDASIKEMGGISACERLKANPHTHDIPIIFLVEQERIDDIIIGLEIGASDYVVSPYALKELKIRIRKALIFSADKKRTCDALCRSEKKLITKVADELGSAMTMIRGFAKPLIKSLSGMEQSVPLNYLEEIMQLTQFGRKLVGDYQLLFHSRSAMENLDPIQIAETAIKELQNAIEEKEQSIRLLFPRKEKPVIKGHARHLCTAVSHLISNAHKFTPRGGSITVAICCSDERVRIEVIDTGIGIPSHLQDLILDGEAGEPARLDRSAKDIGLGLTFVKSVAQQHYGHLGIESQQGEGSRIWIDLPACLDNRDYIGSRFSHAL